MNSDEAELVWHMRKGWVLRAPMRVPYHVLIRMCDYAIGSQVKLFNAMPATHPKKRLLEFAISELQKLRVTQEIREPAKMNLQLSQK